MNLPQILGGHVVPPYRLAILWGHINPPLPFGYLGGHVVPPYRSANLGGHVSPPLPRNQNKLHSFTPCCESSVITGNDPAGAVAGSR